MNSFSLSATDGVVLLSAQPLTFYSSLVTRHTPPTTNNNNIIIINNDNNTVCGLGGWWQVACSFLLSLKLSFTP